MGVAHLVTFREVRRWIGLRNVAQMSGSECRFELSAAAAGGLRATPRPSAGACADRPAPVPGAPDIVADMAARDELSALIQDLAVVHGAVTLSSGREADYYIDLRRVALHHAAAPLIGEVMLDLTADLDYEAAGGLTLGADPVAGAMMHVAASAQGRAVDAFIVRKEGKAHGLQRRIEGPDVPGRRVLVVEDTSTTGSSLLAAVDALREAGAQVVGAAVVVDRGAGDAVRATGLEYRSVFDLADLGLE